MPYTELTQRVITGAPATPEELSELLQAPASQTFSIIDAASSLRYRFFQATITTLESTASDDSVGLLDIAPDLTPEDMTTDIARFSGHTGTLIIDFPALECHRPLPAMTALRVIAATRFAAPRATIIVGEGRARTLNSLQALALHTANGLVLSDRDEENGRARLAETQMLSDGNFKVLGSENTDLVAEQEEYMRAQGFEIPAPAESTGGCGGSCGCGSGGCGA
ncbi:MULTISPECIES: hypothetical protein [unclassified Rothia (in: high G+C Gram-positive bacteria)]|uniref:hypothetical protein n=1 Tax=unclassified Rothia (in: high G+C Gram-positive bacteria) TaxID=2689056 RepID=UPI00195E0783|nr:MULTISPECIES: hypothetical protein [unclassified Rothia (in: high G+C Gram-positive bacteria)]MBM7051774.1 hypothetical protein [Rothia sp. ZJ1223]QRZ61606.1 hypothetical protein JR346_00165 [Rothia sp. ZJ932]